MVGRKVLVPADVSLQAAHVSAEVYNHQLPHLRRRKTLSPKLHRKPGHLRFVLCFRSFQTRALRTSYTILISVCLGLCCARPASNVWFFSLCGKFQVLFILHFAPCFKCLAFWPLRAVSSLFKVHLMSGFKRMAL